MINPTISYVRAAHETETGETTLAEVMQGVQVGRWAEKVEAVRTAFASGGKDAAAAPKRALPGILFSGTFTKRAASALTRHSGLICADLDDLGEQLTHYRELLIADPHTLACFVSPSGNGLKVVYATPPGASHLESFKAAEHYVTAAFGLEIDQACKDVSRLCFVSHDSEAFFTDDAVPLPMAPAVKEYAPLHQPSSSGSPGDDYDARGDLPALLLSHGWTRSGKHGWTRPDKTSGISATWDKVPGRFYVFSSSTQFEANHTYRPWHVYAILEHGGDWRNAARALGQRGFGEQRRQMPGERFIQDVSPATDCEESFEDVPTFKHAARRVRHQSPPPEPKTRLFLAGKPIATPGNLVTLISRAKTGKTATIGAAVAAIIGAHYDRIDIDTFGFTAPHTSEAVVLIDTEQSNYDAWLSHSRAIARSGQQQDPDWLMHYAFVGYSARQLRESLPEVLDHAKQNHHGVFSLILDGVADFVNSVNDDVECNQFVAELQALAVKYDCPILCVIHSNEAVKSGDDGRGHLGKQLTRKAESNLLLKKIGEVTTITSEKQRKAPITPEDGVAFMWSDEAQRHITCESNVELKPRGGRPRGATFDDLVSIFPHSKDKALTKAALMRYAADIAPIKDTAMRDLLADAVSSKKLVRHRMPHGFVYYIDLPPAV